MRFYAEHSEEIDEWLAILRARKLKKDASRAAVAGAGTDGADAEVAAGVGVSGADVDDA